MSPKLDQLETQALQLPLKERAQLAERLIASLDEVDEAESERLWAEEAERRYQEYKKGNISSRPAGDLMRDARAKLSGCPKPGIDRSLKAF